MSHFVPYKTAHKHDYFRNLKSAVIIIVFLGKVKIYVRKCTPTSRNTWILALSADCSLTHLWLTSLYLVLHVLSCYKFAGIIFLITVQPLHCDTCRYFNHSRTFQSVVENHHLRPSKVWDQHPKSLRLSGHVIKIQSM